MSAVAVDTLRIARNLEAAGVERRQAEAHAEALRVVADASREDLATKGDIAMLGAKIERLEGRIDGLEGRIDGLEGRIDGLEGRIDGVEGRIDGLAVQIDGLAARIDGLERRTDGLEGRIDGLAGRIDGIHRELVTIRWALGLVAAFVFATGLRVFGLL